MMSDNNTPLDNGSAEKDFSDENKKDMNTKEENAGEEVENKGLETTPEEKVVEEVSAEVVAEPEIVKEPEVVTEPEVVVVETPVVSETVAEESSPAESPKASEEDIEEIEDDEAEHFSSDDIDVDKFDKKDFVDLAEKMLEAISKSSVNVNDVRNVDSVYKEIRAAYDEIHGAEVDEAKAAYVASNGNDEGFAFKNDNYDIRFESLMIQIRDSKNAFFRNLDALKEDYFERKTNLLQKLREVVDEEEKGGSKENWEAFKAVQNAWRDAGNVNSPHNGSLWSAYNALLDRYFDIRSIQNELKELDRKKNLEIREEFVVKIEEIAASLKDQELTSSLLKKANEYLNEYKQTGPGPRKEQEVLWERMKAAFDIIYDKRRGQNEENEQLMGEVFAAKSSLVEKLKPYANFDSDRINDWNAKTKEVQEIQEQWTKLKGPMPRDKARDTSKLFWKLLKDFFKAKSAFFNKLEAERKVNLDAKEGLCKQVEALVEAGDVSADNTNTVINLQKDWKNYGHVPQKFKDSIYKRFKKACDAFFDLKRAEGSEKEKEYVANLKAKEELCAVIEGEIKDKKTDLTKLAAYKKQYGELGFVPRKSMDSIQKRFVEAINAYVLSSSDIDKDEKDKLMLKNEVEVTLKTGGNPRALERQENDLVRKLRTFEDEVTQLKTNIEFFGRSKGAEKIKAEYQKKIEKAENEASKIKEKLNLIREVS
ncbi:DUF349 domain-containing protein [uncultured Arcticibacterium sp.]|uniref:DUF349 domain-containing protein n=1 Tax=uncultured Arcticibacterium sp. TaxID=2173042 RepID=UPI0030F80C36